MKNSAGLLLCVALAGCVAWERQDEAARSGDAQKSPDAEPRLSAENEHARTAVQTAAIAEVARRTNLRADQLEARADRDGNEWRVVVNRLPVASGGRYFLRVSNAGAVVEFLPGL